MAGGIINFMNAQQWGMFGRDDTTHHIPSGAWGLRTTRRYAIATIDVLTRPISR